VPDYLMHDKQYGGGIAPQFDNPGEGKPVGSGWVARQWDPAVRQRYRRCWPPSRNALMARCMGKPA
jgi:hypothetical protein